jgi:hypothetical protein
MLYLIETIAEVNFFKEGILEGCSLLCKEVVIESAVLFVSFVQCIFYFRMFTAQFLHFCLQLPIFFLQLFRILAKIVNFMSIIRDYSLKLVLLGYQTLILTVEGKEFLLLGLPEAPGFPNIFLLVWLNHL